jgi:hypothetical protein
MGILKTLFGNGNTRKSGIYIIQNEKLIELENLPGEGSINDIIKSLGYELNQIHTILTYDSKDISNIGVKVLSKIPVFVITREGVSNLKTSALNRELTNIDWSFEYDSTEVYRILNEGIESKNLKLDFMCKVMQLDKKSERTYKATNFGLLLNFDQDILVSFSSSDGLSAESKWLKDLNPKMFNSMLLEAKQFHNSEMDALFEVHNQCLALRSIPDATNNPFLQQHLSKNGNYNYFNVYAAHYSPEITIEDFLKVNKGRYIQLTEFQYKVNNFVFNFNDDGILDITWND